MLPGQLDNVGRQPRFVVPTTGCLALRQAMLSERHRHGAQNLEFPPHMFDYGAAAGGG